MGWYLSGFAFSVHVFSITTAFSEGLRDFMLRVPTVGRLRSAGQTQSHAARIALQRLWRAHILLTEFIMVQCSTPRLSDCCSSHKISPSRSSSMSWNQHSSIRSFSSFPRSEFLSSFSRGETYASYSPRFGVVQSALVGVKIPEGL